MRHDAQVINRIKEVQSFPSLLKFLRDDLDWPITSDDVEDLTFDYSPDELGFDKKMAVKVRSIKQLRPLVNDQPWGIFYIDFEPKRLPVGALRRLLRSLVVKKRGGGDGSQATWNLDDLLFISFHGEESRRTVAFAHFHERDQKQPQLRTFYWDHGETEFASVLESLGKLNWPQYAGSAEMAHVWRQYWGAAFRVGHGEVIRDSKALSKKLAQVALKIRHHVFDLLDAEDADKGPLHRLFASFKKALLHDLDEQRFADVLAQTFTYGLLAAKAEIGTKTPLEIGHLAEQIPATNPLLRELFEEFQHLTGVGLDKLDEDLGDLGIDELVDLLNTVDVDEALKNFGRTTMSGQEDPVVHFYEEFLKDYDKEQKVERGVFYTPKPVVSFIVRSVHEILQKEFGLEDGLASTDSWDDMVAKHEGLAKPEGIRGDEPFVQILDPAVGTGTFLEACIQLIYDTMAAKWSREGKDVKAEWNRYVPEHLLPRLHGFELMMAPYVVCHMKLGLRLKELGYDFKSGERLRVYLTNALEPGVLKQSAITGLVAAVAHEAHDAAAAKREQRFTAIIGNPPYSKMSGNLFEEAVALIEPFRFSEGQRIMERAALALELNLQDDYAKFFGLAQKLTKQSGLGVVAFISNSNYLSAPTLRGFRHSFLSVSTGVEVVDLFGQVSAKPCPDDANVFDIEKGVCIGIFRVDVENALPAYKPRYAGVSGSRQSKYDWLATQTASAAHSQVIVPQTPYFRFCPTDGDVEDEYRRMSSLESIFGFCSGSVITSRDSLLIGFNATEVLETISVFGQCATAEEAGELLGFSIKAKWDAESCREKIEAEGPNPDAIIPVLYRPFDIRALYYDTTFIDTPSRPMSKHVVGKDNLVLGSPKVKTTSQFCHAFVSKHMCETKCVSHDRATQMFPLYCYSESGSMFGQDRTVNLRTATVARHLDETSEEDAAKAFFFIYAVLWSGSYSSRYGDFIKDDYPRIPQCQEVELFDALAKLGDALVSVHLRPSEHFAQAPSRYVGATPLMLRERTTYSGGAICLNGTARSSFEGVPEQVWDFAVGGYQPAQKWLKDRKGRVLTEADIRHYEQMLYAIEETIRIMAEIDEVIEAHGGWPGAFQTTTGEATS